MTMQASGTHLVLIPSFNPGQKVFDTVAAARACWNPVWVIVDASTDGTDTTLLKLAACDDGLKVIVLPSNLGKGGAVLHGAKMAENQGFTHALTLDSDGQHPSAMIPQFMAASIKQPNALVLGKPVFDSAAPQLRVQGRKISNWWANLETLWQGIGDSLYGFRVYPLQPLIETMEQSRWMRRFDFDVEIVVRLCWYGLRPLNIDAPVKYFSADDGGVSHFKYGRDNVLLTGMHIRLFLTFLLKLPMLVGKKMMARPR